MHESVATNGSGEFSPSTQPSPNGSASESLAQTEDLVRLYLDQVGRYPLLSREEEIQLAQAIEAGQIARDQRLAATDRRSQQKTAAEIGGERAFEAFVNANLRLVVSIARRYRNTNSLELLDLIQEGNFGLIHAVEKFNWRKGFKFSTYATWWIKQTIERGITNSDRMIRYPVWFHDRVRKIGKAQQGFTQNHGRLPTNEELAEEAGLDLLTVSEIQSTIVDVHSLDEEMSGSGGKRYGPDTTRADLTADEKAEAEMQSVAEHLGIHEAIRDCLQLLTEQEGIVLALYFGLQDGDTWTLAEIGRALGVSRERVRQVKQKALSKLKRDGRNLRDWL
ncbi:sigma-70 family RNA polymerase sigma factor [Candidatus Microgenomates bacterium]|nr:sigma-70 family RNA polymerase sigma factor [Candidatus Microgenomates bacterium]